MRIASVGHAAFAVTLIGLGILGLVKPDFAPVWQPVPDRLTAHAAPIYLCSAIAVASGAGLLIQRTIALAARVLFAWLLLWFLLFRLIAIILAPTLDHFWPGFEFVVVLAGAWVLYVRFATAWDRRRFGFVAGNKAVLIARAVFGLALIFFGANHFIYLKNTVDDVPRWLPWHLFWAYFTGCCLIAGGLGVVAGVYARLAAALAALEIGLFVLLVWVPIVAAGSKDAFQWSETIVSWAIMAGAWIVAESYRGAPWLAMRAPETTEPATIEE